MKRRHFLQLALLTSSSLCNGWPYNAMSRRGVLIWLELRGGNDGLNTVIPFRDETYLRLRPTLKIRDGIPISNELAFHPALSPLMRLWKTKQLCIALGVGWPNPNRSHFKATDQWATANVAGEGPGWLANAMDVQALRYPLIGLGPTGSKAMDGGKSVVLHLSNKELKRKHSPLQQADQLLLERPLLKKVLSLEQSSYEALAEIQRELPRLPRSIRFSNNSLGKQLGLALQLISSPNPPPFLQIEHSGYDTHTNQLYRQEKLLGQLAQELSLFNQGLNSFAKRPLVTVLITSEFGRRLAQNGSGGTDHGSASISLLMGDQMPNLFIGNYPSLQNTDSRGDLISNISPPELYQIALNSIQ